VLLKHHGAEQRRWHDATDRELRESSEPSIYPNVSHAIPTGFPCLLTRFDGGLAGQGVELTDFRDWPAEARQAQ